MKVKIIQCFQQKGKCRDCIQLMNTCDYICLAAHVKHHRDPQNYIPVTKHLRFVRILTHSGFETQKKSFCKTNRIFASWLNAKASLEILKLKLHSFKAWFKTTDIVFSTIMNQSID